jgi:hypothetical protein
MHAGRIALITLTLVAPISIELHAEGDTLATVTAPDGAQFEIAGGTGVYAFVSRGCEGQILQRRQAAFRDAGARVQVPLGSSGAALGVRAGIVRDDIAGGDAGLNPVFPAAAGPDRIVTTNRYLNPYLTFDPPGGSVGMGWVVHRREFITAGEGAREHADHPLNDFSAHVRLGSERHHFEARWMEGMPIYSDGGYLTMGVGGLLGDGPWRMFVGLGAGGPYEGAGLALRGGRAWDSGWNVSVRSRVGMSGDANASGVAVGVGWSRVGR